MYTATIRTEADEKIMKKGIVTFREQKPNPVRLPLNFSNQAHISCLRP